MFVKRSISIPAPLNKWLEKIASKEGISISRFISHQLKKMMDEQND